MAQRPTLARRTLRRSLAALAGLATVVSMLSLAPAAAAAGSGTIGGVVSGDETQGWDNNVRVRLFPEGGGTVVDRITDPATGAWSATLPAGTSWTIEYVYRGSGNFLSRYEGGATGATFEAHDVFPIVEGETITVNRTLPVGGSISGTLAGTTGPLTVGTIVPRINPPFFPGDPRVAFDPATGDWRVDRLHTSSVRLEFSSTLRWRTQHWQNSASYGGSTAIAAIEGVDLTGYDVLLSPSATIAGVVTGATNGEPIHRVTVALRSSTGSLAYRITASDGVYEFNGVAPGTYTVCFSNVSNLNDVPRTFQWLPKCYGDESTEGGTPITIAAEQWFDDVNVSLSRNSIISGAVSVFNLLYSGTDVTLYRETAPGSQFYAIDAQTTTGSGGIYTFRDLDPANYIVSARRPSEVFGSAVVYYPAARFFRDAAVIPTSLNSDVELDTIILDTQRLPERERVEGPDRFSTGTQVTQRMFPDGEAWTVPVVYIANGLNYPDALSAGPAAAHLGGALLLVLPNSIPAVVRTELGRLSPERIVVVGGPPAVSAAVEAELAQYVDDPETQLERLGGASRYDTALAVIKDAFRSDDDIAEDVDAVFLASGANYPDALAAGPAAAWRGGPVIMLDPRKAVLPDEVREFIAELAPREIFITGSTLALPASIDADIEGLAEFTDRLSGSSRFETSLLINQAAFQFETEEAVVATGLGFADALSGGPFAAQMGAPLYLAQKTCIDLAALQDMSDLNVQRIRFLGSSRALSDDVYNFVVC